MDIIIAEAIVVYRSRNKIKASFKLTNLFNKAGVREKRRKTREKILLLKRTAIDTTNKNRNAANIRNSELSFTYLNPNIKLKANIKIKATKPLNLSTTTEVTTRALWGV